MKPTSQWLTALSLLSCGLRTLAAEDMQRCRPWEVDRKPRVFILSDICNEPDDTQSMIRLLTHANQYDIKGLVATTSYWLNHTTAPDEIENIVRNYGSVLDNLQVHGHRQYPTEEHLLSIIKSGPENYGLAAVDAVDAGEQVSDGAQLLIDAVDASSEPLYVQAWGGANTIAQALRFVQLKRSHSELVQFCEKMRVYAISDQDNTGPWIRHEFPQIRYIASVHSWNAYGLAAWTGISGEGFCGFDDGGPDSDLTSNEWIKTNIQLGTLGKLYPDVMFIMEGDSPSMLFTMQNGLNVPEHPEWGGWGGSSVVLDATESYDPDSGKHSALNFSWWMYREITATQWLVRWEVREVAIRRDQAVPGGSKVIVEIPSADKSCRAPRALHMAEKVKAECQAYHVILEVSGPGAPPMTRYRRVILKVQLPEQEARVRDSMAHEEL
ncbi:hypothetical protein SLS55_006400 [Diplodia seriata]|uniref:Cellulose-binding protein n=1 Tax=Diplodia seriata TaxID=420778 RepID=A0ABR3CE42_9PEZI